VINFKPPLMHHFFDISIGKLVAAVPSDAEQNDIRGVMSPFERRGMMLHEET
jgi:hypothetical protein